MNKQSIVFEICVDSVESALAAQQGGAQRVELCDNLLEGGTTPSAGAIALARQQLSIGLNVIIRPRGGDFHYSALEFEVMKYDVTQAKALGANGIVIGLLNADGTIDQARTAELMALARPCSVTFHRAFDMTVNAQQALEDLIALGVDRVLTTGQESSAVEGVELIAALVQQAANRIIVMPGGLRERNIQKFIQRTGVKEVHMTARMSVESAMTYRQEHVFMGGTLRPPEYSYLTTDPQRVATLVRLANEL